jgi:outer membrane protein assembly factor BamB
MVAWTFQAAGPIESSVAVLGRTTYVVSKDGVIHALDLPTGTERWSAALHATAGSASPLIVDGLVIVGDQAGTVHAFDPGTGAQRWERQLDGAIDGAAAAVGHRVLTATEAGRAYAIDARSGTVAWTTVLPAGVTRSVTASADSVFVGAGGALAGLRLSDGTMLWQSTVAKTGSCGTPTVAAGLVYDAAGLDGDGSAPVSVVAVDATTGAPRWRYTSPTGRTTYTPAVSDGRAYLVSEDGTVVARDAATGSAIWSTPTGAPNEALPALADGLVYVATDGGALAALDVKTGTARWRAPIVGVPYAPVVSQGYVFVATSTGNLYAIGGPAK